MSVRKLSQFGQRMVLDAPMPAAVGWVTCALVLHGVEAKRARDLARTYVKDARRDARPKAAIRGRRDSGRDGRGRR